MKGPFNSYALPVLTGFALAVLPFLYFINAGVQLLPLNPHEHVVQNGLTYFLLLIFTYLNHTVFVPRWYLSRQYGRFATVAVVCIVGVALLPHRIEQWVFFKPPTENTVSAWVRQILWAENLFAPEPEPNFRPRADDSRHSLPPPSRPGNRPLRQPPSGPPLSSKLAIIFLMGSVSTLASVSIQTANRLRKVENETLQAELRQLKAQIHPHFLFNTLNSIYALAIRKDDRTAETIVKLSEFMRYMIRDAHRDKVLLATETNYISNYIDLQKARLRDAVQVNYALAGAVNGLQIAPLLLFSFIENAFKYGVNPDEDSVITIELTIRGNELHLYVFNKKVKISDLEASTGVGLQNSRDRLRLLYPEAHQLRIDDAPAHFRVDLTLTLVS